MKRARKKKTGGQAIVEYIIIIVIVAVAALTVMGIFSDRIRTIIAGVATTFGAEDAEEAWLKTVTATKVEKRAGGGFGRYWKKQNRKAGLPEMP